MLWIGGITGNTGGHVARALLERGERVRALVRDPGKAVPWKTRGVELVEGDLGDVDAIARALDGARGAYLLVPPALQHPRPLDHYAQAAASIRAAALRAGLPRLVFLSSVAAHLPSGTGPIEGSHHAERILVGAAPRLTFLRPCFFQENWQAVTDAAVHQGILPTFLADLDAKYPMVATADIGRAAADLLLDPDPAPVVELAGPEPYSGRDAADAVAATLGRPVAPVQPPREAWVDILVGSGVGRPYAELIAAMYDGINSGHVTFSGSVPLRHGGATLAETVASWPLARAA